MVAPVSYHPSIEAPQADEGAAIETLKITFRTILDTTSKDYGHAVRGVHAKGHGIVTGKLVVRDGLPATLSQGLFAQPGSYDAVLRFSTAPGDILDDSVSSPRGIGLKVLEVPGDRLAGSDDGDQDFLMVNGPVFGAPTPARLCQESEAARRDDRSRRGTEKGAFRNFSRGRKRDRGRRRSIGAD